MTKKPNIQYTAVKALIRNQDGAVLVLKQQDPTISGDKQYHPPGGIIELGETTEECVVREVKEEIGVACKAVSLFDVGEWLAERDGNVMQFVGLYYVCTVDSTGWRLQPSEVSDAVWVGLDNIDDVDILEPSRAIIKKLLLI